MTAAGESAERDAGVRAGRWRRHVSVRMNPISILIVEGNPSFLRVETFFFQKHCRAEAVVVAAAGRGEEALAQAKALRPDVILFESRGLRLRRTGDDRAVEENAA